MQALHPLVIVAAFVVVTLAIHPFQDGNGRPSRVLTTLLPLRAGSEAFTERFGSRTARDENPDVDAATLAAVVTALNDFSLELHRAVASADPGADAITSGYGAATALALALAGTDGDTRADLANLLGVDRPFAYVLRDRVTGTVLFTGRVLDPGA